MPICKKNKKLMVIELIIPAVRIGPEEIPL